MKLKPLALLLPTLALGGCIEDILDPSNTGTLPISGISGLTYETDTLSGDIVDSQFKYKSGETVKIKLGSHTLLTLDSDDSLSLSDLIEQFPTSEDELNTAYFEDEDFESFQILANFMQLIHNLDADGNYANGFDLTAYTNAQNIDVDLAINPNAFYSSTLLSLSDTLGSQRTITPVTSIGQLFSLANQHITIEQISQQNEDTNHDDDVDEIRNYYYDDMGFYTGYEQDENLDTVADYSYRNSYSSQGLLTATRSETDSDNDGNYNRMWEETFTFNDLNLVAESTFASDHNGDGVNDYSVQNEYGHDSRGNVINETETEYDSEGTAESFAYSNHTYTQDNKLTQTDSTYDNDADGVIDSTHRYSYTYNANGDLQQEVRTSDDDNNGIVDTRRVEQISYNANGDKTEEALKDYDSEGTLGFNQTQAWSYDAAGNILTYTLTVDYYGDGETNYEGITERTYDANGKLSTSTNINYREGELSDRTRYSYIYDEAGKQTKYVKEEDEDLDGEYDSTYTVVYTYTASGNYATRTVTEDEDNDGTLEEDNLITYTYTTNNKGEKSLLQEYLTW